MSQEQSNDLIGWWSEQSFPGKELFQLNENGDLVLQTHSNIKERLIASLSDDNRDIALKNLLEKFSQVESKVRELEIEWLATEDKLKLGDKVVHTKELLNSAAAVGDYQPLALLVHDWEHTIYTLAEENYAEKLKVTELAENLAQSEDWKETAQVFRDITDRWKHMGQVDRARNDKLWARVEAARKAFLERKRKHHEEEEKDMLHNLDLKIDLVEQAEAIAASEDWKTTAETFQRLTEEWKSIGHTVNKKNEELWQRFITAKGSFFDRKREHAHKVQAELEKNYEMKQALVEKAEQLKDSTSWNDTTQAFTTLMDEWKAIGRVPHEKGDDLWKRFIECKEQFFDAKKKHFDTQKASLENNYQLKQALLDRAEEIKNSSKWGETTSEMVELMEEWKKIGPIPRSYGDKLWEDFNAARKHFFARKDANREQRKQFLEYQKVSRVKHAKETFRSLQDEIREEEEKLIDFKNGLDNITPGKKAAELRAHLENLIAEGTENLKKLKQKFAQAQKDMAADEKKDNSPKVAAGVEETKENEGGEA